MFTKSLDKLTREDIEVHLGEPESAGLEFKEGMQPDDPWYVDQLRVKSKSKHRIFREIIAFANRSGGTLILGLEESADAPPTATSIQPLPKVHELAEKLLRSAHGSIEPQLPLLEVAGVVTEDDGTSGVVIFRVGASAAAPHRMNMREFDKECFIRRNTECVAMEMRAIHDLVIQRASENADHRLRLRERRDEFVDWMRLFVKKYRTRFSELQAVLPRHQRTVDVTIPTGFRATALPASPFHIPDVATNHDLRVSLRRGPFLDPPLCNPLNPLFRAFTPSEWTPMYRGVRFRNTTQYKEKAFERFISANGLIEDRLWWWRSSQDPSFYTDDLLQVVLGVIEAVILFRNRLGLEHLEFELEFGVLVPIGFRSGPLGGDSPTNDNCFEDAPVAGSANQSWDGPWRHQTFGGYSIGSNREIPSLLDLIQREINNSIGAEIGPPYSFETFDPVFNSTAEK